MPRAHANGIDIEYEQFGRSDADPILLVMGLGAQLVLWDELFCEALATRGYRVIRFDNRDVGLSTKLDALGIPDVVTLMGAKMMGQAVEAPYRLSDMGADAVGLLDALSIDRAHVVGASMGGMIAQVMATEHPERVRSLTSIMSSTGDPSLPPPTPEAASALLSPVPKTPAEAIERAVGVFRIIAGTGLPFDEERIRRHATRSTERCFHPQGPARQLAAILASDSRRETLGAVRAPTLVVHGAEDPLVPLAAGRDTAESIPGAKLLVVEGMGHDLPREAWPQIVDAIHDLASRA